MACLGILPCSCCSFMPRLTPHPSISSSFHRPRLKSPSLTNGPSSRILCRARSDSPNNTEKKKEPDEDNSQIDLQSLESALGKSFEGALRFSVLIATLLMGASGLVYFILKELSK